MATQSHSVVNSPPAEGVPPPSLRVCTQTWQSILLPFYTTQRPHCHSERSEESQLYFKIQETQMLHFAHA
jgi:hypothetical protein